MKRKDINYAFSCARGAFLRYSYGHAGIWQVDLIITYYKKNNYIIHYAGGKITTKTFTITQRHEMQYIMN